MYETLPSVAIIPSESRVNAMFFTTHMLDWEGKFFLFIFVLVAPFSRYKQDLRKEGGLIPVT